MPDDIQPIERCSPEEREQWEAEAAQQRPRQQPRQLTYSERQTVRAYVEELFGGNRKI